MIPPDLQEPIKRLILTKIFRAIEISKCYQGDAHCYNRREKCDIPILVYIPLV